MASETDLREAFRQLALDLDAVREDDPDLYEFDVTFQEHDVSLYLRGYKGLLTIHATGKTRRRRPRVTFNRASAIDKLGRDMGVDQKLAIDDDGFVADYDWSSDDASAAEVASLLRPADARRAVERLGELGVLPVWITDETVGIELAVGLRDLEVDRVRAILAALCDLEASLGTADQAKDRSPVVGPGGRKLIRKEPRTSALDRFLDWSPFPAFISIVPLIAVGSLVLPGYGLDRHWGVLFAMAGVISTVMIVTQLRALAGQKGAFGRALLRTFGITVLGSGFGFLAAHGVNRWSDTAAPSRETVEVVAVGRPTGKSSGWTKFKRKGTDRVYSIGNGWNAKVGRPLELVVHPGALGWTWVEK